MSALLIKIKYDSDKGWALLDEREFVEGVHERYVEPNPEPAAEAPRKPRKARKE